MWKCTYSSSQQLRICMRRYMRVYFSSSFHCRERATVIHTLATWPWQQEQTQDDVMSEGYALGWQCSHPIRPYCLPSGILWENSHAGNLWANLSAIQLSPNNFQEHRTSTWGLFLSWGQCFGVNSPYQLCMMTDCGQLLFLPALHSAVFFLYKNFHFHLGNHPVIVTCRIGRTNLMPRSGNKSQTTTLLFFLLGMWSSMEWHNKVKGSECIYPGKQEVQCISSSGRFILLIIKTLTSLLDTWWSCHTGSWL